MFSPASLNPPVSSFFPSFCPCVGLCPTVHSNSTFEEKVEHGHSGGVLPGPIPNPEVKPSCVDSCTVVREPTETIVAVSPSLHLGPVDVHVGGVDSPHPHAETIRTACTSRSTLRYRY